MATLSLLSFTACDAQIKNAKTESVKIFGNCEMCETTIEKAGNSKKIAKVDWDKDTKMATITYDAKKTKLDAILKRIALSGYDSERFLAPANVYAALPDCCQYERKAQTVANKEALTPKKEIKEDHSQHKSIVVAETKPEVSPLKSVFDNYFVVKDALVKTDGNATSSKAKNLQSAINTVKMEQLTQEEHNVWMKVLNNIKSDVQHLATTKDIAVQRTHFITLSKNIYDLIKVSKQETPTYFQHCPMANDGKGANWLSKESAIKNPYYGSQMLSCGNVVETIK